jgi:hypothetical protein
VYINLYLIGYLVSLFYDSLVYKFEPRCEIQVNHYIIQLNSFHIYSYSMWDLVFIQYE